MSRLGYVLAQSKQGFEPLAFSDDKYKRKIVDSRTVCSEFDQAFGPGSDFYEYLMFGDDEAYLYIAMPLKSSRAGDCISVMTVVPSNVKVSGDDLQRLVSDIKDALGKNSSTALTQTLNSLFSKDYPDREFRFRPDVGQPSSVKFACRQLPSPYSLSEILDKLFQPYYYGYRAIFLTEKSPVAGGDAGSQVVSLTDKEIKEYVALKFDPLTNQGIRISVATGAGNPRIPVNPGDVLPFARGSKVFVFYDRPPFKGCKEDLKLEEDISFIPDAKECEWKLALRRDMFQVVTSQKGRELPNASVFVNDRKVDGCSSFSENELKSATVKVVCSGYSEFSSTYNLWGHSIKSPLQIPLDDATLAFEIHGTKIRFTLPRDARIGSRSPLRGYDIKSHKSDGTTVLTYKPPVADVDVRRAVPVGFPHKPRRRVASFLKSALMAIAILALGVAATLTVEYVFFDGKLPFGKAATESVKHGAGSDGGKAIVDKALSPVRPQKEEASGSESASAPAGSLVPDQAKEQQKEKGHSPDADVSEAAQPQDAVVKGSAEAAK